MKQAFRELSNESILQPDFIREIFRSKTWISATNSGNGCDFTESADSILRPSISVSDSDEGYLSCIRAWIRMPWLVLRSIHPEWLEKSLMEERTPVRSLIHCVLKDDRCVADSHLPEPRVIRSLLALLAENFPVAPGILRHASGNPLEILWCSWRQIDRLIRWMADAFCSGSDIPSDGSKTQALMKALEDRLIADAALRPAKINSDERHLNIPVDSEEDPAREIESIGALWLMCLFDGSQDSPASGLRFKMPLHIAECVSNFQQWRAEYQLASHPQALRDYHTIIQHHAKYWLKSDTGGDNV